MTGREERRAFLTRLLERSLDRYERGECSLEELVREVEATVEALFDVADSAWVESLRTGWGRLEIVYASYLDDGRSGPDPDEREEVKRAIAMLRRSIAGQPSARDEKTARSAPPSSLPR